MRPAEKVPLTGTVFETRSNFIGTCRVVIPIWSAHARHLHVGDRAGHAAAADALVGRVWSDRVVEENDLQSQIPALCKVLGPDRELVRTVSGAAMICRDLGDLLRYGVACGTSLTPPQVRLTSAVACPISRQSPVTIDLRRHRTQRGAISGFSRHAVAPGSTHCGPRRLRAGQRNPVAGRRGERAMTAAIAPSSSSRQRGGPPEWK